MDSAPPSPSSSGTVPWALLVVLVAPLVGILALRAPVINTLGYNDTWFYTGYGWTPAHHVEVFDWFYYGVRFPATLPIGWFTAIFGPVGGFLVLRLLIFAATGWAVYAVLRRHTTAMVAGAAVLLLCLNPFYLRLVLWDYTTYVTLPCTIAGAAVWYLGASGRRSWLTAAAAGALLSAAIYANAASVVVLPTLFAVETVAALRGGRPEIVRYLLRCLCALAGAVLTFALGYLGYAGALGWFAPGDLIRPTLDYLRHNQQFTQPFQVPAHIWLRNEPRVYAPLLICLATVVVLGPRLLKTTIAARLAQFAVAYTAFVWLMRALVTSSFIEQWVSYGMTAVTACFALPLILEELREREAGRGRRPHVIVAVVVGAWALSDLVVRSALGDSISFYGDLKTKLALLVAVLAVGAVAAIALRLASGVGRAVAAAVFTVAVAVISLTPAVQQGNGQPGEFVVDGTLSLEAYGGAHDMLELIARHDQPDERTTIWTDMQGLSNVSWVNLPHQQGGIQQVESPTPFPELPPQGLDALRYPTTRYVLVMTQTPGGVDAALGQLRKQHLVRSIAEQGDWVDGKLHYALVDMRKG